MKGFFRHRAGKSSLHNRVFLVISQSCGKSKESRKFAPSLKKGIIKEMKTRKYFFRIS
jgi:hypothetical protein